MTDSRPPLAARSTLRSADLLEAATALSRPGALVLLVGEPGSGKRVLAEQAIQSLISPVGAPYEVATLTASQTLSSLPFSLLHQWLPDAGLLESADVTEAYAAVLAARGSHAAPATTATGAATTVLLVDDADSADDASLQVIAALSTHPGYRLIVTAREPNALPLAIAQLLHSRDATVITLGPLTYEQSLQLATELLGATAIEPETASRLHLLSGGNPLFLTELIASLRRSDALDTFDGLVTWPGNEVATQHSLAEFLMRELSRFTAEARSALFTVALAEPVTLAALATLTDVAPPDALDRLLAEHVIREETAPDGTPFLRTSNQLIGDTARLAVPPGQRITLLNRLADTFPVNLETAPGEALLRGITAVLDAGRTPSIAALSRALDIAVATSNFRLTVRLGRIIAALPDAPVEARLRAAAARLVATRYSGVAALLGEQDLLTAPGIAPAGSSDLLPAASDTPDTWLARIELGVARADILLYRDDDVAGATKLLASLGDAYPDATTAAHTAVLTGAFVRRAYAGDVPGARAILAAPNALAPPGKSIEIAGAAILIAAHRGELHGARAIARTALPLALARTTEFPIASSEIFAALYMSEIFNGQLRSAARLHAALIDAISHPTYPYREGTGLVSLLAGTLLLARGNWGDACAEFAAAIALLRRSDGTGFLALALAGSALALAAAGRAAEAQETLAELGHTPLRASRIFAGPIRLQAISARMWLGEAGTQQEALNLADWAAQQQLPLVELRALHLAATAPTPLAAERFERAEALKRGIGTQFARAIAAAMRARRAGGPVQDCPAVRRVARSGVQGPLLWRAELSPREREVAGLAVLGYSSKHIASALGISGRTVEAHLAKVYTKLGVNDRDGLALHLEQRETLWAATSPHLADPTAP